MEHGTCRTVRREGSIDVSHELPAGCSACAVRNQSLCGALTGGELLALNAISRKRTIPAGQTVLIEGDQAAYANVVDGVLLVKKMLEDGREQIITLLFPSDFMGRVFRERARASVEAATDTTLCVFDRRGFEAAVAAHPALERKLLSYTLHELDLAREWMLLLGQKSATERLATFLVLIAERMARADGERIVFDLPITRAHTAAFLGVTIETVSRKLTQLRKAGIIALEGTRRVEVRDRDRLRDLAGANA